MSVPTDLSPERQIARIEASCKILKTPSGNGHMVWRSCGEGPPLVLLHGSFGTWLHWIRNIEALSRHFRVLAADMPGFGDSDEPADPLSCVSLVETIAAGVDELTTADESVRIAGFSYGASMSTPVAMASKRKIDTICLVASNGLGSKRGDPGPLAKWHEAKTPDELHAAQRLNVGTILIANPENIDDLAVHIQTINTAKTRFRSRLTKDRAQLNGMVEKVDARLTSIWGTRDAINFPYVDECIERLRVVRPDVDVRVIENMGHWIGYEAAEKFNPIIVELLGAKTTATA